ncbi:MAG: hypothetical protein M9904_01405 [Chitinophagaceae bacterium]|nr:hypothetical protein [Chitinophagaceae bacterium]
MKKTRRNFIKLSGLTGAGLLGTGVLSSYISIDEEKKRSCAGQDIFNIKGRRLYFSCAADNDLYRVMTSKGKAYPRFSDAEKAVDAAPAGSGVLILADAYPEIPTRISSAVYEQARSKKLRLYVEYPGYLPGVTVGKPKSMEVWERAVVATEAFEPNLPRLRILQINGCHVLPVRSDSVSLKPADLVLARIVGYNKAVYGLPQTTTPLLMEVEGKDILVSTTKLSQFITARYGPSSAWTPILDYVLDWVYRSEGSKLPDWTPTVRTSYGREDKLPKSAEHNALTRGLAWYNGFLLNEPWLEKSGRLGWKQIGGSPVIPRKGPDEPYGNGRYGILEGHVSYINADGSQPIRNLPRGDCNAESAMAYALGSLTENKNEYAGISTNLLEYVYNTSGMFQGPPNKPSDGWYGLLGWYEGGGKYGSSNGQDLYWGNDGSKSLVATMVAAAALKTDRWDEALMSGILGNFRTTGPEGFRNGGALRRQELKAKGWEYYAGNRTIIPWPQREGWAWANYLWLYDKTRYEPLLVQARKAIQLTMRNYPRYWRCALYEMQMERGRILLPLAWLVRVDDTPEHRRWLYRIIDDMTARMDASGAIQEELIATSLAANEDYGGSETSIVQRDGDPCVDVFYSMAPAFLGMHEAVAATGDKRLAGIEERMAEFLIRIQARSENHKDLDGSWFRAFDYSNWEYWGANGDTGWGAWCSETGWLQSHVVATLAVRKLGTSLWDMTSKSKVATHFPRYRREMEIDKAANIWESSLPLENAHIGLGIVPYLQHQPDGGMGADGLVDGRFGDPMQIDSRWCGFRDVPFDATVKFSGNRLVRYIGAQFMQDASRDIYFPALLEVLAFKDGDWHVVGKLEIKQPEGEKSPIAKEFGIDLDDCKTEQIRIRAIASKALKNKSGHSRIFVGELIVKPYAIDIN